MNKPSLNIVLAISLVGIVASACVSATNTPTTSKVVDYSFSDDASKYRPEVESVATPEVNETVVENEAMVSQYAIDDKLDAIIDSMYVRNDTIREWNGFTILVYSGNNELEAGRVRNRLFDMVPDQEAKFSYKLPTYFVSLGQYFQKVEALPLLTELQQTYPSAAIVPEKFAIPIIEDDTGEN